MAMLAEPKRKQKWTLNPRGKHWSEDSNKFGQRMLEKMGWTSGKGLGAHEQGMIEHVRVKFKDDAGGIGYSKDDQDKYWTEHQENFNDLLQKLQTGTENSAEAPKEIKKSTDLSGKSLEMKSKQSRARVHYQKFTRGKDVNKYSTKDLANIFGKRDLEEAPKVPEVLDASSSEPPTPIGATDTTGGVLTVKGGSMSDYFKSKFPNFQLTPKKSQRDEEKSSESESERYVGFGFSSPSIASIFSLEKSKLNHEPVENKTPMKRKSEFYVETPNSSLKTDEIQHKSKKLKASDNSVNQKLDFHSPDREGSEKKGKTESENYSETSNNIPVEKLGRTEERKSKKKKKKEKSNSETFQIQETPENSVEVPESSSPKKSKKKKKKEMEPVECIPQSPPPAIPSLNSLEPPKKPPRTFLRPPGLPLECPDPSTPETPKKSKKLSKKNPDVEKSSSESQEKPETSITEPPVLDQESLASEIPSETPKKSKKSKKKNHEHEKNHSEPQKFVFENPGLDLESPEPETTPVEVGINSQGLKKTKKRKTDNFEGFINPALNLDSKIEENPSFSSNFEVSRQPGVSNDALDLSDECSNKKRVTFNDEIEYNTDLSKKKKKTKRKLDKFEVDNEKLKKKKIKKEVTGYVNPVLEEEDVSEEIIDNEENERKSQKSLRKRKRRISNLETIEEIPEEEGKGEEATEHIPRKKSRKRGGEGNSQNFKENFAGQGEINKGEKKLELGQEVKVDVLQQNNSGQFFSPREGPDDRRKRKLKSLFMKSPVLQFQGSNINDIKGYGLQM
uniref:Pinx1 protein n=1 Tax=Fopius arisanus TaxID=64838 RepID=A0A0C9QN04_9HYME